ncbi:PEP-CTERM sorting domain-containing protein [Alteromonas hispanica]|uniref:PEP-CTERM sorting domain-containing protein n=1 Tax=Alteromonas hispanica TaxID=315421 RepID=A0A6L9MVI0_9ALTE|nr:PEP-CTERM sorting domain-containing protein [Alteromonas hispanica]NDW22178.1 PEP-CTERM sorting domain-containing protein [Alteromonas hispanica]
MIVDGITDINFGTTIDWSGICSDCLSEKGDKSYKDATPVSGNIRLDGFVAGEDFEITSSNFLSFKYNGPSHHVDNLIINNALYSNDDIWIDASDQMLSLPEENFFYAKFEGVKLPEGEHSVFAENLIASGFILGNLSEYSLKLSFDTYVPVDESGDYIKLSSLVNTGEVVNMQLVQFNINFDSTGEWTIQANGVPFDIGNSAKASIASVPAPASLAIFAFGLIGLVSFRKKA